MKKLILSLILSITTLAAIAQHQYIKWLPTSGTDTYTATITVPTWPGSYSNTVLNLKFGNTNTTTSTLAINGGSAITLRMWDGDSWEVLTAGQIDINTIYSVKYQGSYFEMYGAGTSGGGGGGGDLLAANNLSDLANAGTARTNLGLGTLATQNGTSPSGTIVGTTDTQTLTNKNLNSGTNTFPTFNQNTSGSAATLTTPRTISGTGEATFTTTAFDGSAAVSGAVTLTNSAVIAKVLTGFTSGAGTVSSSDNVLQAFQKLDGNVTLKAPLASPTFTGTVTIPTPSANDNSTKAASTAYVDAKVTDAIADAVTTIAPSQNAVFDALALKQGLLYTDNTQTASYTLVIGDLGKKIRMNVVGANNLTVPPNSSVAFSVGSYITVERIGAGQTTVVPGSGVTVTPSASTYLDPGQNAPMVLVKTATDTWTLWNGTVGISSGNGASIASNLVNIGGTFNTNAALAGTGSLAIGGSSPSSRLHIQGGTSTANSAPLQIDEGSALETTIRADMIENYQGLAFSNAALNRIRVGGVIKDFIATVSNTSTTETDLFTYTTKASTLSADAQKLTFEFGGTDNDATATSQIQVYFGGTVIYNSTALTLSTTGSWSVRGYIIRTASTTARAFVTFSVSGSTTVPASTTQTDLTGLTFTNTNILKVTGTAGGGTGGTGDVSAKLGSISFMPAASN